MTDREPNIVDEKLKDFYKFDAETTHILRKMLGVMNAAGYDITPVLGALTLVHDGSITVD